MTHTYAILKVSPAAYAEIREKLEAAGYQDQFHGEGDGERIDMHGIAIQAEPVLPDYEPYVPAGHYVKEDADGERYVKKETPCPTASATSPHPKT
jgi:hypothetical protein